MVHGVADATETRSILHLSEDEWLRSGGETIEMMLAIAEFLLAGDRF
ncbi:hypothetical protein H6F67_09260 [Microcoleus sp. FACHB-1515]|nr:hypothetical protein [Microcoleus sp. FACHB-1515]MBD2090039.1 hypothetical protein [Microcoleus sp. FACHB-1515]